MKRPRPLSALYRLFEHSENDSIDQTLAQIVSTLDNLEEVEHAKYVAGVATTAIGTIASGALVSVVHKYPGLNVGVTAGPGWINKTTEYIAEAAFNAPRVGVFVYGGLILAEAIEIRRAATVRMSQLED